MERLLDNIDAPDQLRKLSVKQLPQLATEIRQLIIDTVSKTGGHLGSNLGTVELTIALHYCLNTPHDAILWDVGHQAYTHKILTGRKSRFHTLRQPEGLSGFPDIHENPLYDWFTVGHSATSISWALGMACGRDLQQQNGRKIAVVIGDASLAGGMAFEALNHTGHLKKNLIVILNDNEMSISPPVGAMSAYLNNIATSSAYNRIRKDVEKVLKHVPWFGFRALSAAKRLERALKNMLVPGMLFEELGFRYFGPISGQDIPTVVNTLNGVRDMDEPVLIHLLTKKGKGYAHAENQPSKFHSAAKFEICSGQMCCSSGSTFTQLFGKKMLQLAGENDKIVAITAAMSDGTGLQQFSQKFPDRFFDTGIAEEHAVGFAAGLARSGMRPVAAIYSTFLQRGFDQIIHDVCLQNLPVVFALDRAGLVPDDGPTHNGVFDLSYFRMVPNVTVMAPADGAELEAMLDFSIQLNGPSAIRYPKDCVPLVPESMQRPPLQKGRGCVIRKGKDAVVFSVGTMLYPVLRAAELLLQQDIYLEVIDARFVKPLDESLIREKAGMFKAVFTVEDGVVAGGFGSAVNEFICNQCESRPLIHNIGVPDRFLRHNKRSALLAECGLSAEALAATVKEVLHNYVFQG